MSGKRKKWYLSLNKVTVRFGGGTFRSTYSLMGSRQHTPMLWIAESQAFEKPHSTRRSVFILALPHLHRSKRSWLGVKTEVQSLKGRGAYSDISPVKSTFC